MKHTSTINCYACTINVHSSNHKTQSAILQYERVVEYIESLPDDASFGRVTLWEDLGKGYSLYQVVYAVLRDMVQHGIIRCVKQSVLVPANDRGRQRRNCYAYQKVM